MSFNQTPRLGAALALSAAALVAAPATADTSLAVIEIEGTPAIRNTAPAFLADEGQTLLDLIETFDTLAYDNEFDGVLIRLKDSAMGLTQIEELGAAINRCREQGKKVHLFAEGFGAGQVLLGSYADEVIMQQGGGVSLPGLHMEEMYLADTLDWLGLKAQFVQVGDYKGANETMTRSAPSKAWDQNISGLLDSLYANQRSIIKDGRHMNDKQLDRAMDIAWWADGTQAIDAGIIDAEVDLQDLKAHLAAQYDGGELAFESNPYTIDGSGLDMANPLMVFAQIFGQSEPQGPDEPTIAILHIDGQIIDGDSTNGGPFGGSAMVGSRTVRNTIKDLMKDDNIKGVIVRVDSPGGSAIASEVMWQGLNKLKADKPVWISVGSMAASGGFYVLSAGDKVYVNPSSIVGSIGVVGGKIAMGGLYDKAKLHITERNRGPHANLMSASKPWNDKQVEMIRTKMKETYDLFTSRVVDGREGIDLSKTAEGRLFTGDDAIALKMADELGSLDDAINDMAGELDLTPDAIMHYPPPPSLEDIINEMFGGMASAPGVKLPASLSPPAQMLEALRPLLGDKRFRAVQQGLNTIWMLHDEPVLLTSPSIITID